MAKPGDVIDVPELGVRVEFRATAESTGGAYTEVDVIGAPEGLHHRRATSTSGVTEHHTVIEGSMRVKLHGKVARPRAGRRDHDPARHAAHAAARQHGDRAGSASG